jgi:hypothetical protein
VLLPDAVAVGALVLVEDVGRELGAVVLPHSGGPKSFTVTSNVRRLRGLLSSAHCCCCAKIGR